jgi:hypothetical protein
LRLHKAAANNMVHLSPTTVFDVQNLAAYAIFLASYLVFTLGKFLGLKIDRAGAAINGAVGMVAFRVALLQSEQGRLLGKTLNSRALIRVL